ncbi:hypothetical protein lpa_04182 [Legionella pneumophila 2300/99 Alcoy]|nr:hypothetical protein lpa_04182 [Legionella pneumophila 2300/99 Alcoy]
MKVQFLNANKNNAAIRGQIKLFIANTSPPSRTILKETLINNIRQVIILTAMNRNPGDCWGDND